MKLFNCNILIGGSMEQKVVTVKIKDLYLWSENPRDPLNIDDQDEVISNILEDKLNKWELDKLVDKMGNHYDFSELPTIVLVNLKYIVYDGNKRVSLIKIIQNKDKYAGQYYKLFKNNTLIDNLEELEEIPCNLCDTITALENVKRKHIDSSSWNALERDYFLWKHMKQEPTIFVILNEKFKIIDKYPNLNKRYINEEVLTEANLKEIGIQFNGDNCILKYSDDEFNNIFEHIDTLIKQNLITTRVNRGELTSILFEKYPKIKEMIESSLNNSLNISKDATQPKSNDITGNIIDNQSDESGLLDDISGKSQSGKYKTRYEGQQAKILFGRKLFLEKGVVNNLYLAVNEIYDRCKDDKFLPIIGMSLRLLLNLAAIEHYNKKPADERSSNTNDGFIYKNFLQDMKSIMNKKDINTMAITVTWLSGSYNLDAILGKYAHGEINYSREDILKTSEIVADILKFIIPRDKKDV